MPEYLYPNYHLIVMAKVPEAGRVKTRLQPDYSPEFSERLAQKLLIRTLETAESESLLPYTLCVSGDLEKLKAMVSSTQLSCVEKQADGNLGQRMSAATARAFDEGAQGVVVIGTDCPFIDSNYLKLCCARLTHHDVVIGPANDGGYVMIAFKTLLPKIFEGIEWGTDKVFKQTVEKIQTHNVSFFIMPSLNDIDTPEDITLWDDLVCEFK